MVWNFWTGTWCCDVARRNRVGYAVLLLMLWTTVAGAAVADVTVADVTTRAFSVVWVSDEAVQTATVRVFSDAQGQTEITTNVHVTLVSSLFPPALTQGVVKVSVAGLSANTRVFVQTETTGASGTVRFPAAPPFVEVLTASRTSKAKANNTPIVNDVLVHTMSPPGGASAAGTLLMVRAPHLGASPLTAFAGDGFPLPTAAIDLNNLFDVATRESVEVPAAEILEFTEFRGRRCPNLTDHKLVRFRRAPAHQETPAITELETASPCFFADTVCDDQVNILDVQRVLNVFNADSQDCAFNPDLDTVASVDNVINILDVQRVLNRFGEQAPFLP
ncbi:MAG: hypothetical protein AB7N91_31055 [Candidatus Tectimicrobiota bacterium]